MFSHANILWEVYHNIYEQHAEDDRDKPPPPIGLNTSTARCKVPGGWIVIVGNLNHAQMTFVPDPEHKWQPDGLPKVAPITTSERL